MPLTDADHARIRLCDIGDISADEGLRVTVEGHPPLAVWLVEGQVFVTDDTCTHGQASLTETGLLDGFVIECGLHLGAFDIRDGSVASAPCTRPLRTYPVEREGDAVFVHLPREASQEVKDG